MRLAGIILVIVGFAAILPELVIDYSLLVYFADAETSYALGGLLGIAAILLGAILITLQSVLPAIRGQGLNPLEMYVAFVDDFSENIGLGVGWFTTIMVVVVFVNVLLRYVFDQGLLALQDMSWYVFGVIFMIGAAYALKHDRHVRVDIFYVNYSPKTKVWVNFFGAIFFLVPLCILGIWVSWDFVEHSFLLQETSPDAGGLAARYLAKAMMPLGFTLILMQGVSLIFRSLLQLTGRMAIKEEGAH